MKKVLTFLLDLSRRRGRAAAVHDDTLRANQGERSGPAFSFWRALVS
jgi:hypothetical protein